jgi:hypothetical protein
VESLEFIVDKEYASLCILVKNVKTGIISWLVEWLLDGAHTRLLLGWRVVSGRSVGVYTGLDLKVQKCGRG